MTARGRGYNSTNDWDTVRETSYDSHYPDDDSSESVQFDNKRLYITNLPKCLNVEGLRVAFSRFGTLEEAHLSKDPNKKYALVKFETAGEARVAMMKMNKTEPLRLNINMARKNKSKGTSGVSERLTSMNGFNERPRRDDTASVASNTSRIYRPVDKPTKPVEGKDKMDDDMGVDFDQTSIHMDLETLKHEDFDRNLHIKLENLKLERLKIKEQELAVKEKIMILQLNEKRPMSNQNSGSNRCVLPDGRILVKNSEKFQDNDGGYTAGAGDSNDASCSCKRNWTRNDDTESSTPSTCVLCSDDRKTTQDKARSRIPNTDSYSKNVESKLSTTVTVSKSKGSESSKATDTVRSDATSKKCNKKCACKLRSDMTCDLKFHDFYADCDDEADETNRLIQLRNSDYLDIVKDESKLVIALAGYPKSKMRLREMELFQRCLNDVIEMQVKACLLKKPPSFLDYYLNRGAIVCICKDKETRDWIVRISPGLQDRMRVNLILLNAKVKRLCLAVLKIPKSCWPATVHDAFKLLQYFNPSLKTSQWKIYAQKIVDDVECTSFLIDRVSGEIIRGPTFKNIIDYEQMDLELTGYTEIYYECLLSTLDEDISSVTSRVKLLEEIKSANASATATPGIASTVSIKAKPEIDVTPKQIAETRPDDAVEVEEIEDRETEVKKEDIVKIEESEAKKVFEDSLPNYVLQKIRDVQYIGENDEVLIWSDDTGCNFSNETNETEKGDFEKPVDLYNETCASLIASEQSESVIGSTENLHAKSSTINIDSNRGIAYHRRTNYLHIEHELKAAITLEGYPQNKLEGTHIRRLKHLFKEYLHKDMKSQRFANLIIPKFQDIYLSNGAIIFICDSLETKDYLTEILPKFVNSTGLKLSFRDVKDLVRYTRIVMRLSKEQAHVESAEILMKLQEKYPNLKPDCWKYYSDVAGKQKRQFGVDPESLDIIRRPDFDPVFNDEKLTFRIIDRQKKDFVFEENKTEDVNNKEQKEIVANMYAHIDVEISNAPLTRIRTMHYSDLIADDLKLYLGPNNYPDSRIDEIQFHSIKKTFECIMLDELDRGTIKDTTMPKFHDIYLFDGVIFIICQSLASKLWIEKNVAVANEKMKINLKATEFRGAVGIISMVVKTTKGTDEVISILQANNPRLRTKYWRKISTVRTSTKLDVVLQIDKLSAQVIIANDFNKQIDNEPVQFKLGHLQSLIKPKSSLEELTKAYSVKLDKKLNKSKKKYVNKDINDNISLSYEKSESLLDPAILELDTPQKELDTPQKELDKPLKENKKELIVPENYENQTKIILKIPRNVLPGNLDDLNIIFDILEDKNPGLNTEIWQVYSETEYPSNGKFIIYVDKQSLSVINSKAFDSSVGGEKLKFFF